MIPQGLAQLRYHLIFSGAILLAYVVLTLAGHDGNSLFGVLAGQGLGAAIQGTGETASGESNGT